MALLGEDGKPVPANDEDPNLNAEGEPVPEAEAVPGLPKLEISVRPDGNLSIVGPGDPRLVLRMLHEATDLVQMGVVRKGILDQIAAQGAGVQRPGLRDVLAFTKRPKA